MVLSRRELKGKSMKRRTDQPNSNQAPTPTAKHATPDSGEFVLPLELDDIIAVAVFDSVLRVKRRRFKTHVTPRRAK
jgi:hypothetical protein